MTTTADADTLKKLWDMIRDIRVAMLTTEDNGHLRSRPMVASQETFDGKLTFLTRASSHKVDEVADHSKVGISYAEPKDQNYVSLSGTGRIIRDPAQVKAHWSELMRTWFPKGSSDPDIAILEVDIDQAEYWDAPSSTMVYLYGYAKAVTTGRAPHPGEHEKVKLA